MHKDVCSVPSHLSSHFQKRTDLLTYQTSKGKHQAFLPPPSTPRWCFQVLHAKPHSLLDVQWTLRFDDRSSWGCHKIHWTDKNWNAKGTHKMCHSYVGTGRSMFGTPFFVFDPKKRFWSATLDIHEHHTVHIYIYISIN